MQSAKKGFSWIFWGTLLAPAFLCPMMLFCALGASAGLNGYLLWQTSGVEVVMQKPAPAVVAPPLPAATPVPPTAELPGALPPPLPTAAIIPTTVATPTPHPLAEYTIEGLRSRAYPGGIIRIQSILTATSAFTRYAVSYPSDDLTITGVMQIPAGSGPFPVIILNHGYIPPAEYQSGADTWRAANYLSSRGYLTVSPDFRGWGGSDTGNSFFSTGQVIDTLNLISALPSLAQADFENVGIWGHSMGGGVALKAIAVQPGIKAAVLYAPVSANDAEILARWGPGCSDTQLYQLADYCGGAELIAADIDPHLFMAYANAIYNPDFLSRVSPINYLNLVETPVQIHIGAADTRTPPEWSAAINAQLLSAGKPVDYYTYAEQGHALKDQNWALFMERSAGFFDRYLKPPAVAAQP